MASVAQLTLAIVIYCSSSPVLAGYYTTSAPSNVRPGQPWPVTVTIFGASGPVNVSLSLKAAESTFATTSATLQSNDVQTMQLQIPANIPQGDLVLTASGSGGLIFHNSTVVSQVEVASKTVAAFIQTDKAMYKPGQKVQFRAVIVDSNLKPVSTPVNINIKDPNGNVIKQWLNESKAYGVYAHELQLSDQPVLGDWTVAVNVKGEITSKTISVAEYVLPKFEVAVTLPTYFLLGDGNLAASVTAKYTYGKPVQGTTSIRVQLLQNKQFGCSYYDQKTLQSKYVTCPSTTFTKELTADGQATVTLSMRDLQALVYSNPSYTTDPMSTLSYSTLYVEANVTETLTQVTLTGNNTVRLTNNKYQLQVMDITPDSFKPHLVYYGFLKVSQADGQPPVMTDFVVRGQPVTLNVTFSTSNTTYGYPTTDTLVTYTVPENGVVRISFKMPATGDVNSFSFTATISPNGVSSPLTAYKSVNKFMARSDSGIQLSLVNGVGSVKPTDTVNFQLITTSNVSQCFYELLSKGTLVQSGLVNAASDLVMSVQVALTPSLAQRMSPSTTILASCILPSGELVADSLDFNVDGAFANNVSISLNTTQASPADGVSVQVTATPGSYVGLLAVDQSVLLLKNGNDLSTDAVLQELSTFSSSSSDSNSGGGRGDFFPAPGKPVQRRRKRMAIWCMDCRWPIPRGGKDTSDVLKQAGVIMMTNAFIFQTPYEPIFYPNNMAGAGGPPAGNGAESNAGQKSPTGDSSTKQDSPTVRMEFPETWLWLDNVTGSDGTWQLTATVPDTITSWITSAFAVSDVTGLGLAPTAKLTAFKPFFVSLTLPYSVIRGEEFALTITVFNYLTNDMSVDVTVKGSPDYSVRPPNNVDVTTNNDVVIQGVPVAANNGASVQVWVRPETLGSIPITVKATSVVAADAMQLPLLVEAEGFPEEYTRPLFIDLSSSNSTTNTITITFPPNVVSGSQLIKVTLAGDVMGPSIAGLDSLLQMPYGCGEQNMLSMVPNIYVLDYLTQTNQASKNASDKAISYMESGYQRELTYQRSDSSFSAFGQSDPAGSTWLTAFVMRSFQEANNYIYIDPAIITRSLAWLVTNQQSNGSFTEPPGGRVIHTDMQGGSSKGLAMTSYVLVSLLEVRRGSLLTDDTVKQSVDAAITKATNFVASQLSTIQTDPYALAVTTYALFLAKSSAADSALSMLERLAVARDRVKYWTADTGNTCDSLAGWTPPSCQAAAVNVELNAYALLIYVTKADTATAVQVVKWLSAQRNSNGGFVSTQDTVMALMALSRFAALTSGSDQLNMDVSIMTDTGVSFNFDRLSQTNAIVMQTYEMSKPVQGVTVTAVGKGFAILQVSVKYNVPAVSNKPIVILDVKSWKETENKFGVRTCTSWTDQSASGMGLVNINALSGTSWVETDNILSQLPNLARRVEKNGNTLSVYLDEVPRAQHCFVAYLAMQVPISNMQNARAESLAYYAPDKSARLLYLPFNVTQSRCDACPECCKNPGCMGSNCTDHQPTVQPATTSELCSVCPACCHNTANTRTALTASLTAVAIALILNSLLPM